MIRCESRSALRAAIAVLAIVAATPAEGSRLVTPKANAPRLVKIYDSEGKVIYNLEHNHRLRLEDQDGSSFKVRLPDNRTGIASGGDLRVIDTDEARYDALGFRVYFFNIGTSGAALIKIGCPDAGVCDDGPTDVVIDGGSDPNLLMRAIGDHLHWPVDLVILTTPKRDHWKGLTGLLNTVQHQGDRKIHEIWLPNKIAGCDDEEFDRFDAMVRAVPQIRVRQHGMLADTETPASVPEINFHVLAGGFESPSGATCGARRDNSSLAFFATIGKYRFLFTSDIRGRVPSEPPSVNGVRFGEGLLFANYKKWLHALDVATIPNHGSKGLITRDFAVELRPRAGTLWAVFLAPTGNESEQSTVTGWYSGRKRTVLQPKANGEHVVCRRGTLDIVACEVQAVPQRSIANNKAAGNRKAVKDGPTRKPKSGGGQHP